MWHDNAVAQGYSGPHLSHGFAQESPGVIVVFSSYILLQGIEHASRKERTCEYYIISYMIVFVCSLSTALLWTE